MSRAIPFAAVAVLLAGAAARAQDASAPAPKAELGKPAPDFTLRGLDGKTVKLSDLRAGPDASAKPGKIVVLDFWSCTCPGSIRYEERLAAFTKKYAEKGVAILALAPNATETPEQMKTFLEERSAPYPVLHDKGNSVCDAYGAQVTPTFYVVDRAGVLRYRGAFDNSPGRPNRAGRVAYLEEVVDALLAGRDSPHAESRAMG
ncbi:MAG: redoxin domain-containing protein [Planctomycetales bacterium]|nr:redoxin domain-containing protein [Planctomycetales bacterium]